MCCVMMWDSANLRANLELRIGTEMLVSTGKASHEDTWSLINIYIVEENTGQTGCGRNW